MKHKGKEITLFDLLTTATIEAKVFLTNTQLKRITKNLQNKKSSCCGVGYKQRPGNTYDGNMPCCDYVCNRCDGFCTIHVDIKLS